MKGNAEPAAGAIQNVDGRWEMFGGGRGVLAASVFYKYFDKPIERVVIAAANPIATFQNSDHARNFGIELEAGRQLGRHFFLNANYTFVDSKITLLPGAARRADVARAAAGRTVEEPVQRRRASSRCGGFSTRVLFNYFGDRISDVGANEAPDIIEQGRGSLDLVFAQRIARPRHPRDAGEPDRQRLPVHADAGGDRDAAALQAGPHLSRCRSATTCSETRHDHRQGAHEPSCSFSRIPLGSLLRQVSPLHRPRGCPRIRRRRSTCPGIDKPVIVVTGDVTGNETWVNTNYYVLRGAVFVRDGATLNIQAGTRIIGESGSVGTLIVERGGRLNAIGTPTAPIVFTSDQPFGQRGRGDWGGIIINGRAPVNFGSGEAAGEGDTGVYGGTDPNDNSGTLRYVRVEFSGVEFSPDNELNGIAFQAVGRGTQVDHVQAHMSRDDAMEWFGGHRGRQVPGDVQCRRRQRRLDVRLDRPAAVRGRHAAWRRRRQRDRGGQQRVQQQRAAALEPADLQHHVVRRSRPERGRREPARREPQARHGVHDPQLPGHRIQDHRLPDQRRTNGRPRSTTALRRWAPAWRGTSASPERSRRADALERARLTSTAAASRTSARTSIPACRRPPARITPHRTSSRHRSRRWPAASWRPSSRRTTASSKPSTFIGAVPPAPAPNWMAGWTSFPQN